MIEGVARGGAVRALCWDFLLKIDFLPPYYNYPMNVVGNWLFGGEISYSVLHHRLGTLSLGFPSKDRLFTATLLLPTELSR